MRRKFHNARCRLDIKIHYLSLQEWAEGEHDRTTGGNRGPFPPRQFVYPLVRTARNLWISGTRREYRLRLPLPRFSKLFAKFLVYIIGLPFSRGRYRHARDDDSRAFATFILASNGQKRKLIASIARLKYEVPRGGRTSTRYVCTARDRRGNKRKRSSKRRRAIYHTRFTDSPGETSRYPSFNNFFPPLLFPLVPLPASPRNSMLLIKMQMSRQFRNSNGLSVSTRLRCLGRHNVDMPRINNKMVEHRRTI